MDRFHIMEELGSGRCSTVYRARERGTLQYRAIKSVEKKDASTRGGESDVHGKERMDRVLREVKVIYRLKHPNILRFYNWYETTNHLWLILEYCTGGDLLHVLTQDRALPERCVKVLGVDLLAGLQHLHHSGVLYCDLKPSNVLIDEYGVLKLCDFGLARDIPTDASDAQKTKRGTPCYMAPELFTDDGVYSCASDLWALGCVLFEMVVGVPPFVSDRFEKLVDMILAAPLPRPARGAKGEVVRLSRDFRDLLEGLLCKVPADRMTWSQVLNHPFWSARPTPGLVEVPDQPLFDASVRRFESERKVVEERRQLQRTERRVVRRQRRADRAGRKNGKKKKTEAKTQAKTKTKTSRIRAREGRRTSRRTSSGRTAMGSSTGGSSTGGSSRRGIDPKGSTPSQRMSEGKRRERDAADAWGTGRTDALRMSRIAQQNADKVRHDSQYGDVGSSHELLDAGGQRSARRGGGGSGGGGGGRGVGRDTRQGVGAGIGGVDTEVDFDDPLSPSTSTPTSSQNARGSRDGALSSDAEHASPSASRSLSPADAAFDSAAMAAHETSAGDMFDDEEQSEEELEESRDEFDIAHTPSPRKDIATGKGAERRALSAQHRGRKHNTQRTENRPTSADEGRHPRAGLSSPNAMATAAWDTPVLDQILKPQPRGSSGRGESHSPSMFVLPVNALTSASSVRAAMTRVPAMQVSPISGNDTIERISPPRFKASALTKRFQPHSLSTVMGMDEGTFNEFLERMYLALGATGTSQSERLNMVGYFCTLCGVANLADLLVESPAMGLFVRLCRKLSNVPALLIAITTTLAKLFRHATFISAAVCGQEGMMPMLVKLSGARDRKVRRSALAALGELLFYVTTEDEEDVVAGSSAEHAGSQWIIPGSVVPLLLRCLKSEDSVLSHYACKTVHNIYSQAAEFHMSRFATPEIAAALVDIACRTGNRPNSKLSSTNSRSNGDDRRGRAASGSGSQKNALCQSAMSALGQLALRAEYPKCEDALQRALSVDLIPALLEGMSHHIGKRGAIGSKVRSRARHAAGAYLDVVNYILLHSPAMRKTPTGDGEAGSRRNGGAVVSGSTLAHVVGSLAEKLLSHARFLPCILYTLEHIPAPASKGRALLSLQMAVANDVGVLTRACQRKLLHIIDRLWNQATSDSHRTGETVEDVSLVYLRHCLTHTCKFLVHAVVSHAASAVEPMERAVAALGGSAAGAGDGGVVRSPMVMRKLARASASAERTFPALLQLLNSNPMAGFFHDVSLVRILARHVRIAANRVYARMAAIMTDDGPGAMRTSQKMGYRRSVFLLIETLSQRPAIVAGTHAVVVSHLLPAMACCLEGTHATAAPMSSEGGNDMLLSLRIISDLLTNVLRVGKLRSTLEGGDGTDSAVYAFVCQSLLPKYSTLLGGATPDPLPQLALKMLCTVLDRDQQGMHGESFVVVLHRMRLVRRIITNLSHQPPLAQQDADAGLRTRDGEEASVHAARALWYILRWKDTSMLELHRFDLVHRLRKATVAAWRQNASACFEPLLACTEAVLLHACKMIRNSFVREGGGRGGSSGGSGGQCGPGRLDGGLMGSDPTTSLRAQDPLLNLKEVREYCRELLRPEYVLTVSTLVADHAGESPTAAEETRLRASQCLLLMGQFLGAEFFDVLADHACLTAIEKALVLRHDHAELLNAGRSRNVSMAMRLLQLLVFALESGDTSQISHSLAAHRGIVAALRKCEGSADSRDLHTARSGSWAGLSISALSHIVMQKMR